MSLAETAELAVNLKLGTTGSFAGATSELTAVERAAASSGRSTNLLSGGFGRATAAAGKFGGALGHAKHSVGELLTGPLGVLGLAGGVGGLGIAFEHIISHTNDFAFSVEKLTDLTGGSAEQMSTLLAVFEKFNIDAQRTGQIVGFAEKTLGNLAKTSVTAGKSAADLAKAQDNVTKAHERLRVATLKLHELDAKGSASASQLAAARFRVRDATAALNQAESKLADDRANKGSTSVSKLIEIDKEFGLHLIDSKGKLADFDSELKQVADVYTSSIDPARKAALAAQLFGRGYADLVPILALGSKGITEAEQAAKDLGLTLTAQNAKDLKEYRESLRETGDAIGGLELQLGLALVPAIKDAADAITRYLAHGGRDQIVGFFKSAIGAARELAGFVTGTVIPTISALAGGAKALWDSIPGPLRDLLIKGFVANKTIKFLFGVDLAGAGIGALKDALGIGVKQGLIGAGLGKLFVQPVFVTNPGFGIGGGLGGAAGAAEGAGLAEGAAAAGGLGLGTIAVGLTAGTATAALGIMGLGWLIQATSSPEQFAATNRTAQQQERFKRSGGRQGSLPGDREPVLAVEQQQLDAIKLAGRDTIGGIDRLATAQASELGARRAEAAENRAALAHIGSIFSTDLKALIHATKALDIQKAAKKIGGDVAKGMGDAGNTTKVLAALNAQLSHALKVHDPQTAAVLRAQIARVEHVLPDRQFAAKQYAAVAGILKDGKITSAETKQLHTIMAAVKDRGLPAVTKGIQQKIDAAKKAIDAAKTAATSAAGKTTEAIKDKDLSVSVTVPVTTNVSIRDLARTTYRANSFGRVFQS